MTMEPSTTSHPEAAELKKNHCRCIVADSLAFAARNFKYWLDTQRQGAVKTSPDPEGVVVDVRTTILYQRSSAVLAPAQLAFEDADGAVCPYLVLLRAIAAGCFGGQGPSIMDDEVINILRHSGVIESDDLSKIVQAALDRLQGRISGRLVPDWLETGVKGNNFVK